MAAKNDNPFTNTRLMLAGVVVGVVGIIVAFVYMRNAIEQKVGDEVFVYYLVRDLPVGQPLESHFVKPARVRRDFASQANQMITLDPQGTDQLQPLLNDSPNRNLKKGDVLLASMFDKGSVARRIDDQHGRVMATLSISNMSNPGKSLAIGSVITVRGALEYSEGNLKRSEPVTLLRNVRVSSINGDDSPDFQSLRVNQIGVMVSDKTALLMNYLMTKGGGSVTGIDIMSNNPAEALPDREIPPEALDAMKKLKIIQ